MFLKNTCLCLRRHKNFLGNYRNRNSPKLEMPRSHLSWASINLEGNCLGAVESRGEKITSGL